MQSMDLNLLIALDALLQEGSVVAAARRMNLSAPAMSRTLSRIRQSLGDPVLVRAGRNLVPTPRALELQGRVRSLLEDAQSLMRPEASADISTLDRSFTLRASDYVAGIFGARLIALMAKTAPNITLRFALEGKEDVNALREGHIDLDIGALRESGPEIRVQSVLRDSFVGVVRKSHPLLEGEMSPKRFAAERHVSASRRGRTRGPIDDALEQLGLSRNVNFVVPGFYAALFTAASSDIVATMPCGVAIGAEMLGMQVQHFTLPLTLPTCDVMQAWHPRFDNDAGHRFLRQTVKQVLIHPRAAAR